MEKLELTGMARAEITDWARENGFPAFRGKQIFEWIHRGADFDGMTNVPKDMREKLKAGGVAKPVTVQLHRERAREGTVRVL